VCITKNKRKRKKRTAEQVPKKKFKRKRKSPLRKKQKQNGTTKRVAIHCFHGGTVWICRNKKTPLTEPSASCPAQNPVKRVVSGVLEGSVVIADKDIIS